MILDIIFVRHGLSCANVLSATRPTTQFFYQDPELSLEGVYNSQRFSNKLINEIEKIWGSDKDYLIGSSQMIRAQETAFHMLAKPLNKDIHVFPHIGEIGITYDNHSLPKKDQNPILTRRSINKGILEKLPADKDYREWPQTLQFKSHFPSFIEKMEKHFRDLKKPTLKLVIFTHGRLLREITKLPHFSNNNATRVIYDLDEKVITNKPTMIEINNKKPTYECPDECRKSRCSDEESKLQDWGNAGRRERKAVLETNKMIKHSNELRRIQQPKTFKNYIKRAYYGVKGLFNRKTLANRIASANRKRNNLATKIKNKRKINQSTFEEQDAANAANKALQTKPSFLKRMIKYIKGDYD